MAVALIASTGPGLAGAALAPVLVWTPPAFEPAALVGIGLPLFLVTMASQNVPGMAMLAQFGFRPPLRPILTTTGLASVAGALFGGHAVNLAAISGALAAGPDADPDPGRRWVASVTAGLGLAGLGFGAGVATAVILLSPPVLIEAVAGLALLGAMAAAIASAMADPPRGRRHHLRGDGGGRRVPGDRLRVLGPARRGGDDAAAPQAAGTGGAGRRPQPLPELDLED